MRLPRRYVQIVFMSLCPASALLVAADAQGQGQSPAWLGVALDASSSGRGARVGHVVRASPAARAGLRDGDRVTRIARTNVVQSSDVLRAMSALAVGDAIEIAFVRAEKEQSAQVTLGALPSPGEMMRMDLVGTFAPTWAGIEAVSGVFPDTLGALRGRVLIVDFWATWCAPCRVLAPKLSSLQARYGSQGLTVLGVSTEDAQDVAVFAQRTAMRYAVGADRHGETIRAYGVTSFPTVVVIDRRGVIRDVSIGYDLSEDAHLDALVKTLLAEPALAD